MVLDLVQFDLLAISKASLGARQRKAGAHSVKNKGGKFLEKEKNRSYMHNSINFCLCC